MILITGASGLVGMEMERDLAKSNDVWGLSRYLDSNERSGLINAWAVGRGEVEKLEHPRPDFQPAVGSVSIKTARKRTPRLSIASWM